MQQKYFVLLTAVCQEKFLPQNISVKLCRLLAVSYQAKIFHDIAQQKQKSSHKKDNFSAERKIS